MRFFIVVLFISIYSLLHSQPTADRLQVTDNEGTPLIGAVVLVLSNNDSTFLISDDQGLITLSDNYFDRITVQHLGFQSKNFTELPKNKKLSLQSSDKWLEDVVVTGQHIPQSAKNSVYKVQTIGRSAIQNQGVTHINEVLRNQLNLRFSRDNATGSSGLNMLGLGGQYVKVLIDGIPIEGKSGTGNEIDLEQLNIQSIDRIEMVEGPMSVNYGADALGGVINIITQKNTTDELNIDISLHEESVAEEYSWFDQGIHSPSITIGYRLNPTWYIRSESRIRNFGGWKGDQEGRTHDWYPKDQFFQSGVVGFEFAKLSGHYRIDWLDETLFNLGLANDNNPLVDPFAIDEDFSTHRLQHQLQLNTSWKKGNINTSISYSDYERTIRQYTKNLVTDQEHQTVASEQDTTTFQNLFLRSTLNHRWQEAWSFQGGLELEHEFGSGTRISDGEKTIRDASIFSSLEWSSGLFKIRPGIRLSLNSQFSSALTSSVNIRYKRNRYIFRASYGRGFRAPSLRELYHEFIDTNHNILGNEDLEPEYSHALNVDVSYEALDAFNMSLGGYYNYVDNLITFFTPTGANQPTTYTNLEAFETIGFNLRSNYKKERTQLSIGFSYQGQYQQLNADREDIPYFVFSPEANLSLSHSISEFTLSLFGKYSGPVKRYQLVGNVGEEEAELAEIQGFTNLDATVSRPIKALILTLGIRNLMDVTNVNSSFSGSVHGGGSGQANIGYGRSYFLKINYSFSIKNRSKTQ